MVKRTLTVMEAEQQAQALNKLNSSLSQSFDAVVLVCDFERYPANLVRAAQKAADKMAELINTLYAVTAARADNVPHVIQCTNATGFKTYVDNDSSMRTDKANALRFPSKRAAEVWLEEDKRIRYDKGNQWDVVPYAD